MTSSFLYLCSSVEVDGSPRGQFDCEYFAEAGHVGGDPEEGTAPDNNAKRGSKKLCTELANLFWNSQLGPLSLSLSLSLSLPLSILPSVGWHLRY